MRRLYSLLLYLLLPFVMLHAWWRGWRDPALRMPLRAKLGWGLAARVDAPLWVHAASMGELRAVAALLHAMGAQAGPVVITVGTPTGLARARQLFEPAGHQVRAAVWDLPGATRRQVDALKPRALVIIETELWPNLLAAAHAQRVPVAMVSARVSPRSFDRYRMLAPALVREALSAVRCIGAQTAVDRERFIALGADASCVQVTGNLKFDVPEEQGVESRGEELRARWAPDRPLWVAGSTHAIEEEILLDVHRQLMQAALARGAVPPLLAFAPRRPERFADVAKWLAARGFTVLTVSANAGAITAGGRALHRAGESVTAGGPVEEPACSGDPAATRSSPDVILIDAMGVLSDWYAAADVAFVGGSLAPVGGHNLLEPAALAKPVLCGPQTFNAPDVTALLVKEGGARVVHGAADLAANLAEWLGNPAAAKAAGERAAAAAAANRGAARRAVELLTASWTSARSGSG